jgi:hypothetical protein
VSGSERKKMATPSIQKGRSIRILTSSKGTTTKKKKRESLQLDSIFSSLQKNLLFLPSNLLASWQTIPKTFLLAANSQRNEVVEFKLSRGLYMYINSFSRLPFFLHKIRNGIQTPQLPKKGVLLWFKAKCFGQKSPHVTCDNFSAGRGAAWITRKQFGVCVCVSLCFGVL